MKLPEFVSNYLAFTRKDRIGIIVLVVLIVAVYLLPTFLHHHITTAKADSSWMAAVKKLEQAPPAPDGEQYHPYADDNTSNYQYDRPAYNFSGRSKGELFYFDPNTISAEEWTKLGVREKTIHTIQNYLSKGGHFKKPDDLQHIYGLFPDEYERIAPYIRIDTKEESNSDNRLASKTFTAKNFTPKYAVVDINSADTSALIALPGIGSKLAARIIGFREKLGGFYSIAQVGETYGLPDSTFQKLKQYFELRTISIKKININTATAEELKAHPYIRWNLANPIVAYRKEHGPFVKTEDLKKIMAITDEIFNKISPYLTIQ